MTRLAWKNLLHDKVCLAVTLTGIVFALVILSVQFGVFLGSSIPPPTSSPITKRTSVQRQASQAWIHYQASLAATTTAARSIAAAKQILERAQLRYQSGLATTIETVTAQANVAEADDALIRSRYAALLAQARLAAASGDVRSFLPR